MLEFKWLQIKPQFFIPYLPYIRQVKKLPASASFAASVIMPVMLSPSCCLLLCIPDNLWVWAHKDIIPPSLQFLSTGCIYNFIIFPSISNPHFILHLLNNICIVKYFACFTVFLVIYSIVLYQKEVVNK